MRNQILASTVSFALTLATPLQALENPMAKAWSDFAEDIAAAGPWLMEQEGLAVDDPQVVANGYRYLATLLYVGLDVHLLNPNVDLPEWTVTFAPHAPYGGDHRDGVYHTTPVNPEGVYRVTGTPRGGIPASANIQTQDGWWQPGRANDVLETLDIMSLEQDTQGGFELIVGGPEREANWLNLAPDATHMMFRQYIADDRVQKLYDITIERIDEPESLPTAAEMQEELAEKLTNASGFIRHMAEPYIKISRGTLARPNEMLPLSPEARGALGANSANAYWLGSWDLDETEALLIEFTPVPAEYWSLVAHNTWIQALPQTQMQMQLNMLEASRDEDGKVRFVVSHSDPGYANWLSTGDLRRGFLALRVTNKQGEENVAARKVTLDELAAEMPDNSPMVSSDERRLAVETKRRQILTRYGR